jgi:hypothetical protein
MEDTMSVMITQFHTEKEQHMLLKLISPGALVYIDGKSSSDPPSEWQICPIDNAEQLPFTIPFPLFAKIKNIFVNEPSTRTNTKIREESIDPWNSARQAIVLSTKNQHDHARHEYRVASNPCIVRDKNLDSISNPYADFGIQPDPEGTKFKIIEGFEVVLKEKSIIKGGSTITLGVLAEVLDLELTVEGSNEKERKYRQHGSHEKTVTVPKGKWSLERKVSVNVDIGFKKLFTQDYGGTWTEFDFPVCVSVSASPRFIAASPNACEKMQKDYQNNRFVNEVREWISGKLQTARLDAFKS